MGEEISDLEYGFLDSLLQEIDGVGKATAARIITRKEEFGEFGEVSAGDLVEVNGITEEKSERVVEKLREVDFTKEVETVYTEKIIKDFLDSQYEKLRSLGLEDLDINVLLIKALGFTTAEEAIEFYVYQRITRSSVTEWGQSAVEDICFVSGAEEIPADENVSVSGKRFDMKKEKGSETYYIQLKSGPNTMNVGMVNSLNEMVARIEEKHEDAVGMLGMTYGTKSQVSSQIRDNLDSFDERSLIGEDFWEFLTGDEEYYGSLIRLIDGLSTEYEDEYRQTYLELVETQTERLEEEWEERYGSLGREGLDRFVEEYTGV